MLKSVICESAKWRFRISMVQNFGKYIFVYILYILYTLYNAQTSIFLFPIKSEKTSSCDHNHRLLCVLGYYSGLWVVKDRQTLKGLGFHLDPKPLPHCYILAKAYSHSSRFKENSSNNSYGFKKWNTRPSSSSRIILS